MFERSSEFIKKAKSGAYPIALFRLNTDFGNRIYGKSMPDKEIQGTDFESNESVISFGKLRTTLAPIKGQILQSLGQTELPSFSVSLSNINLTFSKMMATESLLSASGTLLVGYQGFTSDKLMSIAEGRVYYITLTREKITLAVRGE